MGLDNGIIIRGKSERGREYLKGWEPLRNNWWSKDEYEFGYWRKCWNVRQRFLDIFDTYNDEYEIKLTISDIPTIVNEVLRYFLNEDNWEYEGHCSQVFSWIEELPSIANAMSDLNGFYDDVVDFYTDDDFDIWFYDSY